MLCFYYTHLRKEGSCERKLRLPLDSGKRLNAESERMTVMLKLNPADLMSGVKKKKKHPPGTKGRSQCCSYAAGKPADSRANVGEGALPGGPRHLARRQEDSAAG